ncbi:MAG: ATP-dependent RecD-like DNA helicase [Clostridia bacterium]
MELEGQVKTIVYRNEENGFTVLVLTDDTAMERTAVGNIPLANVGERIELTGTWAEHPAYGTQFKAEECRILAPSSLSALISYLGSGLIKGVGESTAKNIVATFGMDTLNIMEKSPDRLLEVPGIGRMRATTIAESFALQRDMRDIMLALQRYDISILQAMKLYKIYGPLCLARIQENPYRLIDDVESIGFRTADKIARNAGIEAESTLRLRAGIKYTMQCAMRDGHTFVPRDRLIEVAAQELGADIGPVERIVEEMIINTELVCKIMNNTDGVFLPYLYRMESECAKRLLLAVRTPTDDLFFDVPNRIARLEVQLKVDLAPSQRQAVLTALDSGAMVITGGPGTGKTTILQFIIRIVEELGLDYELCAPTGRAAKRMSEATGYEARTIHRMLEYSYAGEGFARNEDNPIMADIVIVDEMSMVDVQLMQALLKSIGPSTRLVMVGDADQLPSVGAGNVLRDIIDSGVIPVICLNEIFRQADRSMIVINAHSINSGRPPLLNSENRDFCFEQIDVAEQIVRRLIGLCSGKTDKLATCDPLKDVQVLVPMKKSALGVINLNMRMQSALNPPAHSKREKKYGDTIFREGDKVMQIKNNYRVEWARSRAGRPIETGQGVFNGDMGTVISIDTDEQCIKVLFDDERCVKYEFAMLEELELAYCISIHKSQGSEFPIVLLPLLTGPGVLMTRNLLYTAVTRARKQVYMLGNSDTIAAMTRNAQVKRRYSALRYMLKQPMPGM